MKSRKEIEKRIIKLFSENLSDEILAVLLFGSVVKEQVHEESDIDIAVLFRHELSKQDRKKLIYKVYELIPYFFIEIVDVVNLNDSNLILVYQILTKGKLVLCYDDTAFKIFRDARLVQYLDFKKFLEPFYPKISQKLRERL